MFLLVPDYLGCPGQTAVKWLLVVDSSIKDASRIKCTCHLVRSMKPMLD